MPDQYEGFEPDPEPSGFTPDPPKSWYEDIFTVPNAIRFGGSALGSVAAGAAASTGVGLLGSGALMAGGGALGEAGARWWEGKPFDLGITATEGALNLLPGGGEIPGKGAALRKVGQYALQQMGHGAWQGAVGAFPRKQAEEGNLLDPSKWEAPSWGDIGQQTVAGGGIGLITGGTLGGANARFGKAKPIGVPSLIDVTPDQIPSSDYIPDRTPRQPHAPTRDIREGESIADYITGKDDPDVFTSSVLNEPTQAAAPITPQPVAAPVTPSTTAFDPNTLTGLQRTEVEFVDPTTGEVRSSADARPGDVPVPNAPKAAAPQAPSTPSTLTGWIEELVKNESGTFDPVELGRNLRRNLLGSEGEPATKSPAADAFAEAPTTAARAARRVDPDIVMPTVRAQMDEMADQYVQNLINTFEGNPTAYGESGANAALYGRDLLESRAAERAANPQAEAPTRHGDISEQLTQALPPTQRPEFIDQQPDVLPRSYGQVGMVDSATPDLSNPPTAQVPATARPSTELNRIVNGVSGHTRAIIDHHSDEELLDFIRRHTDAVRDAPEGAGANISRSMAAYATEVAESRGLSLPEELRAIGESPERAQSAESQAFTRDVEGELPALPDESGSITQRYDLEGGYEQLHDWTDRDLHIFVGANENGQGELRNAAHYARGILQQRFADGTPVGEVRPPRPGSYAQTVEQLRGMTREEVHAYADTMAEHIYPHDIDPLIAELRRNPTEGTRTAVAFLEGRRSELIAQGVDTGGGSSRSRTADPSALPVKPPVEVTPEMRERSRKRLAAIGGAERADKLISGETVINAELKPYRPARRRGRPNRGEKISESAVATWNRWADGQLSDNV